MLPAPYLLLCVHGLGLLDLATLATARKENRDLVTARSGK
jgi:hypothetical protein